MVVVIIRAGVGVGGPYNIGGQFLTDNQSVANGLAYGDSGIGVVDLVVVRIGRRAPTDDYNGPVAAVLDIGGRR